GASLAPGAWRGADGPAAAAGGADCPPGRRRDDAGLVPFAAPPAVRVRAILPRPRDSRDRRSLAARPSRSSGGALPAPVRCAPRGRAALGWRLPVALAGRPLSG